MHIAGRSSVDGQRVDFREVESDPTGQHCNEPKLQENFRLWQLVGVMAASQATPLVIGGFLSLIVGVGGPPGYIWGFFTSAVFSFMIMLSLAEICCVYPCPAGQIYWSAVLSKNGASRLASYLCGWICAFGWFLWFGGTTILVAHYICALAQIYHPDIIFHDWHVFLINVGLIILSLLWNGPFFKLFLKSTTGITYLFNLGALFIFIALLAKATPKQSARTVFVDLINETGWSSNGIVFFIATGSLTACLSAFDTATHLADEVPEPARTLPLVMIGSTTINFVTGLAMAVTQMFCTVNLAGFLAPIGGQPLIQLLVDSLDNDGLIITSSVILIVSGMCSATSVLCTASRTWWAFARLNGTPFATWLGKTDQKLVLPLNALYLLAIATVGITAISMGSSTAINAMLGGGGVCVFISYAFPIVQLLIVGRNRLPSTRYLKLGKAGLVFNIASALWIPFITVWQCFPLYLPAAPTNMNYTSVILGGIFIYAFINWFVISRKRYTIPDWEIVGVVVNAANSEVGDDTKVPKA